VGRRNRAAHGRVNLIFNNAGVALSSTIDGMLTTISNGS
jgi:NADP-dependent 3-hydroxy acid dehydrogenase YdfG